MAVPSDQPIVGVAVPLAGARSPRSVHVSAFVVATGPKHGRSHLRWEADMSGDGRGRSILVPVANPASVPPLLDCAARLARPDGGQLHIVTVLNTSAPADEHAYAWQGLADAEALSDELGVSVRGRVVEADDPASGVLDAVATVDASLVLMGWRGISSTSDVFGRLIDHIVGRSTVPLAILRLGTVAYQRVLLPISPDHLLPGGGNGLALATDLAARLRVSLREPTTVLRTGERDVELPDDVARLGDRVHHDPRRTHQAVEAFARPDHLIVAAVAPTVSGLRGATTHLAWAAPDATLLVAVDVGPSGGDPDDQDLVEAVEQAGRPAPVTSEGSGTNGSVRIAVTVRLPETGDVTPEMVERVLGAAGTTDHLMAWWPAEDPRPHVRITVAVRASGPNKAIARVMTAVHDAPQLEGAEISYDVEHDAGTPAASRASGERAVRR